MNPSNLVLSLYPSAKGCGYVLFEDALSPFDWGVTQPKGPAKNKKLLAFLERLLTRHRPAVIVLEDWLDEAYQRSDKVAALYEAIVRLAKKLLIPVVTISMQKVREHFAYRNATMKYEIALYIAKIIPAFSYQLPPVRKAWNSASRRQALYDAAAVGLSYFGSSIPGAHGSSVFATTPGSITTR